VTDGSELSARSAQQESALAPYRQPLAVASEFANPARASLVELKGLGVSVAVDLGQPRWAPDPEGLWAEIEGAHSAADPTVANGARARGKENLPVGANRPALAGEDPLSFALNRHLLDSP